MCGGDLTATSSGGTILSPGFTTDAYYENDICEWRIESVVSEQVSNQIEIKNRGYNFVVNFPYCWGWGDGITRNYRKTCVNGVGKPVKLSIMFQIADFTTNK